MGLFDRVVNQVTNNLSYKLSRTISNGINKGIDAGIDAVKDSIQKRKDDKDSDKDDDKDNNDNKKTERVRTADVDGRGDYRDINFHNMTDHMKEVPDDLAEKARNLENTMNNARTPSELAAGIQDLLDVAKGERSLVMGNMSAMVQAMSNTTREITPGDSAKLDEFAQGLREIAKDK